MTSSFWSTDGVSASLKFIDHPIASSRFLLSTTITEGVITTRSNRMKFRLGERLFEGHFLKKYSTLEKVTGKEKERKNKKKEPVKHRG